MRCDFHALYKHAAWRPCARFDRLRCLQIQEKQQGREATPVSPPPTPSGGGRLGMKMLSRTLSGASGSSVPPTWQAVIDDFSKAPGSRLMPMIKVCNALRFTCNVRVAMIGMSAYLICPQLLLLSTADIPEETKTGLAEEAKEAAAAASNGVPRDVSPSVFRLHITPEREAPSRASIFLSLGLEASVLCLKGSIEELRPQPSGVSEAADISQRVTGLDMDDLLGLNEAPEEEKPTQEEATKPEEANADPFTVGLKPGHMCRPRLLLMPAKFCLHCLADHSESRPGSHAERFRLTSRPQRSPARPNTSPRLPGRLACWPTSSPQPLQCAHELHRAELPVLYTTYLTEYDCSCIQVDH